MNRVLNYDKYKLQRSKFWWICILVAIAMNSLGLYIMIKFSSGYGISNLQFEQYRTIANPVALVYLMIPCIFVGNDFKTGTIKNIASKGIKREEIVLSKLIWNFALAILFMVCSVIVGLIVLILFSKTSIKSKDFIELMKLTGIAIIALCAFASITTLISFIVKSSGAAIAISIVLSLVSEILINLAEVLFKFKNLSKFSPNFIANIISSGSSSKTTTTFIISMFVWIIVCSILSIYIFKKQDIK